MSARLWLNLDIAACGAFDKCRYILGRLRAGYRYRRDRKVEVISVNPRDLIQRVTRIGNTVAAAITHGVETGCQGGARRLPHIDASVTYNRSLIVIPIP